MKVQTKIRKLGNSNYILLPSFMNDFYADDQRNVDCEINVGDEQVIVTIKIDLKEVWRLRGGGDR